jgi:dihydropteroate synthase
MFTLNCKGKLLVIDKPVVMGIINATPDSFYAGSRQATNEAALQQASRMLEQGAAMLDIGGQSTRPGAALVGATEEIDRVVPIIEAIYRQFPEAIISIDTFYSAVAIAAANAGASIINDVSAGSMDEDMLATAAKWKMPYICMHNKGIPAGTEPLEPYEDVMLAVLDFFIRKVEDCRTAGIADVIIDPGFGFGKTVADNFELIRKLGVLRILDRPILLGVSRKSSIYKTLGITAEEALNGTTVLNTIGIQNGANILRVHDVKEAMEVIRLTDAIEDKI